MPNPDYVHSRSLKRDLPYVPDAYLDPDHACLPEMQQAILDEIHAWPHVADGQSIYWLRAMQVN